jgi:hypothetical protein
VSKAPVSAQGAGGSGAGAQAGAPRGRRGLDYLAHSQLGFRPGSPKLLTLVPDEASIVALPARIPFFVRPLFGRLPRTHQPPSTWEAKYFRWPFDIAAGDVRPEGAQILFRGDLVRTESRWGTFWRGDFSAFTTEGNFQIESEHGATFPIAVKPSIYDRVQRGFVNYLHCQRSGFENPGIRGADHLDDGVLDAGGRQIQAAGGWYDAGDLRKWMFLTQPNLTALASLARRGHPGLRSAAIDEIRWGNRFFHAMVAPDGQCWEDIAGGTFKAGLNMDEHWWFENHPGCNADNAGGRYTDNVPGSGDERSVRTTYNPAVQFMFVRTQCLVAPLLGGAGEAACRALALKTWRYGRTRGHDRRTLFVAEELLAALEGLAIGLEGTSTADVRALAEELLSRQDRGEGGLSGYFMEKDDRDAFRCIALSCEPAVALARLVELAPAGLDEICARARTALTRYVDRYVLADAASNPFGVGPYGVYVTPPSPHLQAYRDAGRGRGVRTFIHPFNPQQIVHGTGGVVTHQAALCAKAGQLLGRSDWRLAAERMLQWTFGHNPEGLCLHTGVGYRHPTPFSAYVTQLPDAVCVGHIGRPDDTPYQETSPLIEWCTQEIWDIPNCHMTEAVLWL